MQELELEPYIDRFLAEEIDISIVHVLDEADLNSLGIVDRILQIRFMQAAKLVGKERERNKKIKETKAGLYRPQTRIASPRLKQQKLRLEKVGVLPLNDNISHSPRSKRVEEEHSLLSVLYPIAPLREGQSQNPPSDAQAKAQVPLKVHNYKSCCVVDKSVSLFTAAALCRQVTVPLEDRLENRRVAKSNGDSENGGNGSNHQETLERGGIRYHAVHEDRATKVLKLQALQQELAAHESTVVVLKTVISQLQMELDAGE